MNITGYKHIFFAISGVLVVGAIGAILFFGLRFGIDFTGGAIIEAVYTDTRPNAQDVEEELARAGFEGSSVQTTGENGLVVRTGIVSEDDRPAIHKALSLSESYLYEEQRFSLIGPIVGNELRAKAWVAIGAVILAIILFVAFAFRHVSEPAVSGRSGAIGVSSWVYGIIAIVALIHDILIPAGAFAILGSYLPGYEIDTLFVMALLAILGYSVNDTIIIFDRVRENLKENARLHTHKDFATIINESLSQTFARSINTSLTTLVVLGALFLIGGAATKPFALTLAIGVIAGTYSSIFLAAPLLSVINKRKVK
ncbi:MAG: protein translocase subunit SecF [Parcubacteria group bacterium]|nr:protein translocase subunit SecF [Parcubacteria group bacterium]